AAWPAPGLLLVLALALALACVLISGGRRRGIRRHGRRGARRRLPLDEIARPLVEAGVHVVARLVDRLPPGLHDVVLRVVLGAEDRADRLAILVGERDAE